MKRTIFLTLLAVISAFLAGCPNNPSSPYDATKPSIAPAEADELTNASAKGGKTGTVQLSMFGNLIADTQLIKGRNDLSTLSVNGEYILTMSVDLSTLECGDLPGKIPDEPGLIAFVQSQTPRKGILSLTFDKTNPNPYNVDAWETVIGEYKYRVQFFRWQSNSFTEYPDGTTVVNYRGGSIEVFKIKQGKFISREQCFGLFVDYDLIVK